MKKWLNGEIVDMTGEEIAAAEKEWKRLETLEKSRPLTEAEVSRMLIAAQVNSLAVDDNTALRMTEFYPAWEEGLAYGAGFKVQYLGGLYRCTQAHDAQSGWEPANAPALWEGVSWTNAGTGDDPIPYSGNMALEAGKYYTEGGAVYLCTRDTGRPVYTPLEELAGIYVELTI